MCCCAQITLVSRDEASMLVVSYADLKRCLEEACTDVNARVAGAQAPAHIDIRRR